jgi:DNA-binding CsgD family transcriptional regulator
MARVAAPQRREPLMSVLRSAAVVQAAGWLERAEGGRPVAGLVLGAEAMGKSVLARAIAEEARTRGHLVSLVGSYAAEVPLLLAHRLSGELGVEAPDLSPARSISLVRGRLETLSAGGTPVTLVFEDAHEYSRPDLAFIRDLLAAPPARRLALIVTSRPSSTAPDAEHFGRFLREFEAASWGERLDLGPLSLDEVRTAVAARLHGDPGTSRFVRDVLEFTQGRPLYLDCLLTSVAEMPADVRAEVISGSSGLDLVAVPEELAGAVTAGLRRLSERERALLEALALWGLPATVEQLAHLLDQSGEALEDILDGLESLGLVSGSAAGIPLAFVPTDPVVARVVASAIPALRRRRLHDRAASLLDAQIEQLTPEEGVVAAAHFIGASMTPSRGRLWSVIEAARHLIGHSRYRNAGRLLEAVLGRLEHGAAEVPADVFVLIAESFARAGDMGEARRVLSSVLGERGEEGQAESAALLRVARDHVALGRDAQALSVYRRLLSDESLEPGTRALVLIDAGRTYHAVGQPAEAFRMLTEAAQLADGSRLHRESADSRVMHGVALLMRGEAGAASQYLRRAYVSARRSGDASTIARAAGAFGNALGESVAARRGERWLRKAMRLAESCEDYPALSWAAQRLTALYIESGEWKAAEETAATAVHIDAGLHRVRSLRRARALESLLHALQGRTDPLDVGLRNTYRGAEDFGGPHAFVPDLVARFEHELLAGEEQRAAMTIQHAHELLLATPGWERLHLLDVMPRRARLQVLSGDAAGLARVIAESEQLCRSTGATSPLFEPQLEFLRAQLARLEGHFVEGCRRASLAAEGFARLGYRWRAALARTEAGLSAMAGGDAPAAAAHLDAAYATFEQMGAERAKEEVRDALHALGRRAPAAPHSRPLLTERQLEIAELARDGLTDAEIAQRLRLSRRTVTTHMHNIFKAAGLRSRLQLESWLEDHAKGLA